MKKINNKPKQVKRSEKLKNITQTEKKNKLKKIERSDKYNQTEHIGKSDQKNQTKHVEKSDKKEQLKHEKKLNEKKKAEMKCPIEEKCGGCQYQNMTYERQCSLKQKRVKELLGKYGKIEPIVRMENPYYYRNKVHAVVDRDKKGNLITGIYKMGTHHVIPVENCRIENQKADEIIKTIRSMLKSFKIKVYDEDTQYGLLRHILVRCGTKTGQIMVVLVTASPIFPSKNNFVKALKERHPEITTIVQNINPRGTSMVLGKREQVLFGKGYIEDILCGKTFRISSQSFYQVNSVQTEKLYSLAVEFAGLTGKETVIDAYCGIGTIGIIAADKAKRVIGVELNTDAIKDAVENAKCNQEKNVTFYQEDAGTFMMNMAENREKAEIVLMDPPRSGSTEQFIDAVAVMAPKRVVYVSCNPETLARDLEYFIKKGYRMEKAVPVDMFPWTDEIETVCLLSNRNSKPDTHVKLSLDMEEYYKIKTDVKK